MNDRPTLETDEAERLGRDKGCWVRADFARKLERERDELRKKCASWICEFRKLRDLCRQLDEDANDRLRERDKAREKAERYRLEANAIMLQRDEARDVVKILCDEKPERPIYFQPDIDEWMERHALAVQECEKLERKRDEAMAISKQRLEAGNALRKERDEIWQQLVEARAERDEWAERWAELCRASVKDVCAMERERDEAREVSIRLAKQAERLRKERDEAREAVVGWENKWKCAVEMAARAEVERDEARSELHRMKEFLLTSK